MVDRKKRKGSRRASVPKANAKAKAKTHSTGGGREAGPADPNLRLAIIDALVRAKRLSLSVPEARKRDAADAKVREALVRTPLTAELLGSLTELTWHGGHDIQHRIWPEWDGENDTFDIRDLAGIEALANLQKLDLMLLDVKDSSSHARTASRAISRPG